MKIILIGSCVKKEDMQKYPALSVAGNKMLLGFAEGFAVNGCDVSLVSVTPRKMKFLRKNGEPFIQKEEKYIKNGVDFHLVRYVNMPFIKQVTVYFSIKKAVKQCVKNHRKNFEEPVVICVYNTMSYFAKPALRQAKKYGIKTCGIIADLPLQHQQKNLFRRWEDRTQERLIQAFDMLIPLTEYIAKDFSPNIPYLRIEAGIFPFEYESLDDRDALNKNVKKRIVFSGTLNQLSGIELAIAAMEYLKNQPIVLEVYGDGPLKEFVEASALQNSQVKYMGKVSNQEMLSIQRGADLLICPRKADSYTTKYTFPSKVLEYICSGVPVLANRLQGIPEEYQEYIHFAANETPYEWAKKMQIIVENAEEFRLQGLKSRDLVLKKKSWVSQTLKAKRFMEKNICFD